MTGCIAPCKSQKELAGMSEKWCGYLHLCPPGPDQVVPAIKAQHQRCDGLHHPFPCCFQAHDTTLFWQNGSRGAAQLFVWHSCSRNSSCPLSCKHAPAPSPLASCLVALPASPAYPAWWPGCPGLRDAAQQTRRHTRLPWQQLPGLADCWRFALAAQSVSVLSGIGSTCGNTHKTTCLSG